MCAHAHILRIIAYHHLYLQRRARWGHSHLLVSFSFLLFGSGFSAHYLWEPSLKDSTFNSSHTPLPPPNTVFHFNVFYTDKIKPAYEHYCIYPIDAKHNNTKTIVPLCLSFLSLQVSRILYSFSTAFRRSSRPADISHAAPSSRPDSDLYTFTVALEIKEDDGKGNYR